MTAWVMASPGCVGELEEVVGGLDDLLSEAVSAVPAGALEPGRHGGDARALGGASLADRVSLLMRASSRREMGAGASPGEMGAGASPGEMGEVGLGAEAGVAGDLLRVAPARR